MANMYYENEAAGLIPNRGEISDLWWDRLQEVFDLDNRKLMRYFKELDFVPNDKDIRFIKTALLDALEISMDNQETEVVDAFSIPYSDVFFDEYEQGLEKVCSYDKTSLGNLVESYKRAYTEGMPVKFEFLLALAESN